jgi:neurotransmitter:Na+ symporter, NSS family
MTGPEIGSRETFGSRLGAVMTMLGVAIGLGNVWRFPYLVGKFGGTAFVVLYVVIVLVIGVPGLMAEWALGRHTRRGTVGAFARGGLPFGGAIGWFLFAVVIAATGYYTSVIGWVMYYGVAEVARALGIGVTASAILPPEHGFVAKSFALQLVCTAIVTLTCVAVLLKGLRAGIEKASIVIMPMLLIGLLILAVRSMTLPGAEEGLRWYILKFRPSDVTPTVVVAALGHAMFSLSLGGTFMVVYGSYLTDSDSVRRGALWTAAGDTVVGLLAGLAIFPAVFALGMEPSSGPGLLFATLPKVFAQIPAGWLFGLLFFAGLFAAAYLSDVAAFEVLVAGLTDATSLTRKQAVWLMASLVYVLSIPPMFNMAVFVPWDLTFGSGMQTLGALIAVLTVGWAMDRGTALRELGDGRASRDIVALYYWLRYVVPLGIAAVGVWWLLTDVLGVARGV